MKFTTVFALLLSVVAVANGEDNNGADGNNYNPQQTSKGGSFEIIGACGSGSGTSAILASDGVASECCINPADWGSIPGSDQCGTGSDCASYGGTGCSAGTFSDCQQDVCTIYCSSNCAVMNPDANPEVGSTEGSTEAGSTSGSALHAAMTKIGGLLLAGSAALAAY